MKNIVFFFLFIVLFACSNHDDILKTAKIPEDEMISIMVDLAISDAKVEHELLPTNQLIYQKKLTFYKGIFKKYGYTYVEFEEAYKLYSKDLVHLSAMYDKVLEELSKKEIELKAII